MVGKMKWIVHFDKRASAKGEIESHRLACAFSSCAHDNPEAHNGCAVHRTHCRGTETRGQKVRRIQTASEGKLNLNVQ